MSDLVHDQIILSGNHRRYSELKQHLDSIPGSSASPVTPLGRRCEVIEPATKLSLGSFLTSNLWFNQLRKYSEVGQAQD